MDEHAGVGEKSLLHMRALLGKQRRMHDSGAKKDGVVGKLK